MRTTPEENDRLGKEIAQKASAARGPTAVLVPLRGVSAIDARGPAVLVARGGRRPCFRACATGSARRCELIELDLHINDPGLRGGGGADVAGNDAVRRWLATLAQKRR